MALRKLKAIGRLAKMKTKKAIPKIKSAMPKSVGSAAIKTASWIKKNPKKSIAAGAYVVGRKHGKRKERKRRGY